jgi:hypothetical protein
MIYAVSILLTAGVLAFVLFVRPKDLPETPPESPVQHLEDRKAVIYDNLRDLNFEYRIGKLSESDYNKTKINLQNELAGVLAQIDRILKAEPGVQKAPSPPRQAAQPKVVAEPKVIAESAPDPLRCPHCGAKFDRPMKFCGECGKTMPEVKA